MGALMAEDKVEVEGAKDEVQAGSTREEIIAKLPAYLMSDSLYNRLLQKQAFYRSVVEKSYPKQGPRQTRERLPCSISLRRHYRFRRHCHMLSRRHIGDEPCPWLEVLNGWSLHLVLTCWLWSFAVRF
jgi:hypothetical protein